MRREISIDDSARVLEIGSGHNPHPRSDVLCDLYLDDRERAGPLKTDRPFVLGSGERLPFVDGAFDYLFAIHVLEHADDLEAFLAELARVAKAGYIETPSAIGERMFGWRKHRWELWFHEGVLYARRHRGERPFGSLCHELVRRDARMRAVYYRYPDLFRIRLHWQGRVDYRILGPDDPEPVDLDDAEVISRLLSPRARPSRWLRAYIPSNLRDPVWRTWRDWLAARRR